MDHEVLYFFGVSNEGLYWDLSKSNSYLLEDEASRSFKPSDVVSAWCSGVIHYSANKLMKFDHSKHNHSNLLTSYSSHLETPSFTSLFFGFYFLVQWGSLQRPSTSFVCIIIGRYCRLAFLYIR